jgi:hypothetical protein
MTRFTEQQLDALQAKPRPKGTLPYLPDDRSPEPLREWLTRAFRPPKGWQVQGFERFGREPRDPARLMLANGREDRAFRIAKQVELTKNPCVTLLTVSDAWLDVPHLTGTEIEDVWRALCRLGAVLSEFDETDQTREWIEALLPFCLPMNGFTLVPDGRHDALMAMRNAGEFRKPDAQQMLRGGEEQRWQQRPCRFIDANTGEQWIRTGETATYLRWVIGVEPLSHGTLRARLREIGVVGRQFEDYRPPHPKLGLYQLTDSLIDFVNGGK